MRKGGRVSRVLCAHDISSGDVVVLIILIYV